MNTKYAIPQNQKSKGRPVSVLSACVASVSVDTRVFDFWPRENWGKRIFFYCGGGGGGGGGEKETLAAKLLDLEKTKPS